jgi:hypothetical protein
VNKETGVFGTSATGAPCPAIQLPDIVRETLEHLHDDKPALCAAMRVNRTWFLAAAGLLWRSPAQRALQCVSAPERRQFYASKVRELVSARAVDDLEAFDLPALRVLGLSRAAWGGSARYTAMLRHIGPRLAALDCTITDDVLDNLLERHPRGLRWLRLVGEEASAASAAAVTNEDPSRRVASGGLARWLLSRPLPLLQSLCIEGNIYASQQQFDQVFRLLAQHRSLRGLRLFSGSLLVQKSTLVAAAAAASNATQTPLERQLFPQLTACAISIAAPLVPAFVGLLPASLCRLCLVVDHDAHAVLRTVARLATLRSLTVGFIHEAHVAPDDVLALQTLTQLCDLGLAGGNAPAVTHEHLRKLLVALPQLHTFSYWLACPPCSQMLVAIGESCRQLRRFELYGEHNIGDAMGLRSTRTLFPTLLSFKVGSLRPWDLSITA